MSFIDGTIIAFYLAGILAVGIRSGRGHQDSVSNYFLAGRSLKWPLVGAALFATNISTIHLVGLAADGYNVGLVIGNFELMAVFCLLLLALVFAPFYFRSRISTLPEYIERRYDSRARTAVAFIAVVAAMLIHIGISLYAGAEVFRYFFGVPAMVSIVTVALVTAVYTVFGGLRAVVITESLQTVILVLGALFVTVFAVLALPDHGIETMDQFRAELKPDQFRLIHPLRNEAGQLNEFSWFAMFFGFPVLGIWYWCSDQTIVQRVLGARTERDAQLGPLFAACLKLLPLFVMVLPGVFAYVLFRDQIGDVPNQALPVLVNELVPIGMKGLIAAGLLAALMSTIAGALNSCATLVSVDIAKRLRPDLTDVRVVFIGRVSACVIMVLATLWSTQGGKFTSIFEAINKIPVAFAPSISTVFLLGVLWARGTKEAALTTLAVGFSIGLVVLSIDLPLIGDTRYVTDSLGIPFMIQLVILFLANSVLFISVSLFTAAPDPDSIRDVCWADPRDALMKGPLRGLTDVRVLSGAIFVMLITLYVVMG